MSRLLLIHWNPAEGAERAKGLREVGHQVEVLQAEGVHSLRKLRDNVPDAMIIDLTRLPAQGRAVAVALRQHKATRAIPLVFAGGDPEKVARTRELLPDATYTDWSRIRSALREAARQAPLKPVVPDTMAGYSGTPLPKKLGIKPGSTTLLLNAPEDFERTLGDLPPDAQLQHGSAAAPGLVLLFATRHADLARDWRQAERAAGQKGRIWLIWPKRTSGVETDLSGNEVREFGLARDWVDYKICAVDATWSGLCFSRRRK